MASSVFIGWFGGGGQVSWNGSAFTFNGPILEVDGSASAPSYSFASSPTDGILLRSSGNIDIALAGSVKYEISNNGARGMSFGSDLPLSWSSTTSGSGSPDVSLSRGAADLLQLASGDNFNLVQGYIQGGEQTAPSAPAADKYRIFAQDNGAGKTQLMVIFSSGAAQQIAIQP